MDQGPLVNEQIEAGASLAAKFDQYKPLQAAFWFKERETGSWYLYLVSDRIDDTNFDLAYGEVLRLLGPDSDLWLDLFQIKVAGVEDPVAKAVLAVQQEYPGKRARLRNRILGGVNADEVYLYPIPVSTPI